MTSLILVTLLCSAPLSVGTHHLECTADYLHTDRDGQRYYDVVERGYVVTVPGLGEVAHCNGEGHPERLVMRDLGSIVCSDSVCVLCDGFESGDTGNWSKP